MEQQNKEKTERKFSKFRFVFKMEFKFQFVGKRELNRIILPLLPPNSSESMLFSDDFRGKKWINLLVMTKWILQMILEVWHFNVTRHEMFLTLIHLKAIPKYVETTFRGVIILVTLQVSGLHLNQNGTSPQVFSRHIANVNQTSHFNFTGILVRNGLKWTFRTFISGGYEKFLVKSQIVLSISVYKNS